jgi:hypothetical protein
MAAKKMISPRAVENVVAQVGADDGSGTRCRILRLRAQKSRWLP